MTPFILVSCLSAVENINRALIKAPSQRPKHSGIFFKVTSVLQSREAAHQQFNPEEEGLTCIICERPAILVKHKPAFLPRLDFASHFDQESSTGFISDGQVEAGIRVVSSCLDMAMKIKVVFPYREVASQQPGLWKKQWNERKDFSALFVYINLIGKATITVVMSSNTWDLCFSLSFTSLSTSFCLLLVSSCSRFSRSSLLLRSSSNACLRISISRSCTRELHPV